MPPDPLPAPSHLRADARNCDLMSIVPCGIDCRMKPATILLVGLLGLAVAGDSSKSSRRNEGSGAVGKVGVKTPEVGRASRDLASAVHDLQAKRTPGNSTGSRADLGNLWTDVGQLRRSGVNVRAIEYYASDLEQSLRRGQQGNSAARHALNNLEYEASVLRQRLSRQQAGGSN